MNATEFYFLLAIAQHGSAPRDSDVPAEAFVRRGLIESDGAHYRLTHRGQRVLMDRWTDSIVDALDTHAQSDSKRPN